MTITAEKTRTARPIRSRLTMALGGLLLALALAACGSGAEDTATTGTAEATGDTVEATADTVEATADTAEVTDTGAPGDAVVTTGSTDLGEVLVDADGLTLYGFTNDVDGLPTCEDGCADAWPALVVDSADVPDGLDGAVFSVVERSDGAFQLKAGDWPLYTFSGDAGPGETSGQGSGDVWFAVAPDGSLIQDDTAQVDPTPVTDDGYGDEG